MAAVSMYNLHMPARNPLSNDEAIALVRKSPNLLGATLELYKHTGDKISANTLSRRGAERGIGVEQVFIDKAAAQHLRLFDAAAWEQLEGWIHMTGTLRMLPAYVAYVGQAVEDHREELAEVLMLGDFLAETTPGEVDDVVMWLLTQAADLLNVDADMAPDGLTKSQAVARLGEIFANVMPELWDRINSND